jgi:hypothetical protein
MIPETATSSAERLSVVEPQESLRTFSGLRQVLSMLRRPAFILIALTALVLSRGISKGEFFFYADETRHAMNGVFFRDVLATMPVGHPVQFAYEYFAKYPAIAIPHWPPLFYLFEGFLFLGFGLSPWVSRLTVLIFAVVGVYFWYRILEPLVPLQRAFVSAVALAFMPYVLLYERVTMLEIPALAICIASIYFWLRFLQTERSRYLWTLAGFATAGLLISQATIFLVFFIPIHLVAGRHFRLLKRWDVWLALLISGSLVLPWYLLTQWTERGVGSVATRVVGHGFTYLSRGGTYTFYPLQLYKQLGAIALALACVGLVLALFKRSRVNRLMLIWLFSGYLCFVLISEKDPRHTIVWIPPLVYFMVTAVEALCIRRTWGVVAGWVLALTLLVIAIRSERPMVSGVEEVAQYVLSLPESDIVYYQGFLDGDFVFYVRKFDPERTHMVAREKQVVVGHLGGEPTKILQSEEQVANFFQSWGIRYAVIEDHDDSPGLEGIHALLNSGQFELLRTFPVRTNQSNLRTRKIDVFRYQGELHRTDRTVTIPMLTLRHNISANLSSLAGRPWPN